MQPLEFINLVYALEAEAAIVSANEYFVLLVESDVDDSIVTGVHQQKNYSVHIIIWNPQKLLTSACQISILIYSI